ncbi:protein of unknown function [Thermococcus nautili]|nr:protein of unknown function [Thermococcus nautili]
MQPLIGFIEFILRLVLSILLESYCNVPALLSGGQKCRLSILLESYCNAKPEVSIIQNTRAFNSPRVLLQQEYTNTTKYTNKTFNSPRVLLQLVVVLMC